MLYRHVFDKISTEFRIIFHVFVNFVAPRQREISEALSMIEMWWLILSPVNTWKRCFSVSDKGGSAWSLIAKLSDSTTGDWKILITALLKRCMWFPALSYFPQDEVLMSRVGCKESQCYSLPVGQAVDSCTRPKVILSSPANIFGSAWLITVLM